MVLVLALVAMGAAAAIQSPASAAAPGPHDPFGSASAGTVVAGGVRFTGWAVDPDARTSDVRISIIQDGRYRTASAVTSVANAAVTTTYSAGPTPGFVIVAPLPTGSHTLCVVAETIGAGLQTLLRCVPTPLGTVLTPAQVAAHNPTGAVAGAAANATMFEIHGWATDPDYVARRVLVVLYIDGNPAATVATQTYVAPRPTGAGPYSAFDISVPVAPGMHLGCLWAVNVGIGTNRYLGCRARDTRGPAGTATPVTVPTLNTNVMAEAKTHIGQAYVWGAAGPTTFDCSGLVKYSYGKFGYSTPRVSEAQAVSARLIPASRAVPGDLVFTHDTEGDVYHVGLYVSPGKALAAIDPAEGVNYQTIWDPNMTTYGSFTHT
ncbi:MAG: C40 family peptidase [Jatrophihabitans sp.]|uniref:C40 family peptidase n=1 Tax=Jatrophihabitans sp. TaxID=1932789 RepID=UPI0039114E0E